MAASTKTPVFLLKTQSTPGDAYEELFNENGKEIGQDFEPVFVPVLEHRFMDDGLATVRKVLREKSIGASPSSAYGGLVFTSQRAVEAFSKLIEEGRGKEDQWPHLQDVPIYSVGPATTRALQAIPQQPPLQVFGEHTGNGEKLSRFILEHYGEWYKDRSVKPSLLFLVGEQRRDIIPKNLMDPALPTDTRIQIDEVVVYGTGVMEPFEDDFRRRLQETADRAVRWVVVFSPTGCGSMLRALDLIEESTGSTKSREKSEKVTGHKTYIATIGPTTRDYLINKYGYTPEVCAEQPSPEGVWDGITQFLNSM